MRSISQRFWVISGFAALVLNSTTALATCSSLAPEELRAAQAEMAKTLARRDARTAYLHSAQIKLDEIKAQARNEFGDNLPTPAMLDEHVKQLRADLLSMQPQLPSTPAREARAQRIEALTQQLQAEQQQSANDWMLPENQSTENREILENRIRTQFASLSSQLAALVNADNAEQEAAIGDKVAADRKRRELVDAIAYTELQDRQDLIDGAKRTIAMYDEQIKEESARVDALKARAAGAEAGCRAQMDDEAKKS